MTMIMLKTKFKLFFHTLLIASDVILLLALAAVKRPTEAK